MLKELLRILRVAGFVILFGGLFIAGFRWVALRATGVPQQIERSLPANFLVFIDPFKDEANARQDLQKLLTQKLNCGADIKPALWLHAGNIEGQSPHFLSEQEIFGDLKNQILNSPLPVVFEVHQNDENRIIDYAKKLHEHFPKAIFYNHFHKLNDKIVRNNPSLRFASHQAGLIKNQLYLQLNVVDPSLTRFEFYLIDSRNLKLLGEKLLARLSSLNVRLVLNSQDNWSALKENGSISGFVTGAPSQFASSPCQYE